MKQSFDPYYVLGLDHDASREEIRKAYRNLAKTNHPDCEGGSDEAFYQIRLAHKILTTPELKAKYDENGEISDESPLNSETHPQGILAGALMAIWSDPNDLMACGMDLKQVMNKIITDTKNKHYQMTQHNKEILERAKRALNRFQMTEPDTIPNRLQLTIQAQIASLEDAGRVNNEKMKHLDRALEILNHYSFTPEKMQNPMFTITSSTTWR